MRVHQVLQRALVIAAIALPFSVNAQSYIGTVNMLEIWPNGNVAFSMNGVTLPCLGQAIVNASAPAAKNLYAALLGAKLSGKRIQLNVGPCGAADGYSPGTLYATVAYLYVLD